MCSSDLGIYLPHLRNAVYRELIEADALLDAVDTPERLPAVVTRDWDFDGRDEVRVSTGAVDAWFAPARGGILYELDLRVARHNLLATLDRRPEAYHGVVLAGPGAARSVVDAARPAVFKEEGLERLVRRDAARRKMLVDHFWDENVDPAAVADATATERGDFAVGAYGVAVRRAGGLAEVEMTRLGNAWGIPFTLRKVATLRAGSAAIDVEYEITGLEPGAVQHLAVELNFAGLPAAAAGRFFRDASGNAIDELGARLDLVGATFLGLVDEWLGIDASVLVTGTPPVGIWAFPIRTVSQSEGGFEGVHQSVAVMPHWRVEPDSTGTWRTSFTIAAECRAARA